VQEITLLNTASITRIEPLQSSGDTNPHHPARTDASMSISWKAVYLFGDVISAKRKSNRPEAAALSADWMMQ